MRLIIRSKWSFFLVIILLSTPVFSYMDYRRTAADIQAGTVRCGSKVMSRDTSTRFSLCKLGSSTHTYNEQKAAMVKNLQSSKQITIFFVAFNSIALAALVFIAVKRRSASQYHAPTA